MELYSKIDDTKREYYLPAFEALDELATKISSAEFASASFGDSVITCGSNLLG